MSAQTDCDFGEDRISELPDDIILTFLSPMGMKEAAKTSILSKRWRYLWAMRTHLDFDHFLALPESDPDINMCYFTAAEKGRYVNWVNQVVDLHCNPCIDTFKVDFRFDTSDTRHLDKWVKFALLRKVKNLELDTRSFKHVYTLGFDILKLSVGIGDNGITSLTSLHLNYIDVSGDFIEFLLSKCHHLERLYVSFSTSLVRLNVIGLSCKLKQLAIHCCRNLELLEIDAVNLTNFDYFGTNLRTNIVFKSTPMLVEAAFGGTSFGSHVSVFQQISPLAANIHNLSLNMEGYAYPSGAIPTFCNLKHLNMAAQNCPLAPVYIRPLLEACPVLRELKLEIFPGLDTEALLLELMDVDVPGGNVFQFYLDYLESGQNFAQLKTHPNLKQLEVVGYRGCDDVEVIVSVIRSACNLETIILDPNSSVGWDYDDILETSRARACKLQKIIPSRISVIIIPSMISNCVSF